jgi:putative transposase
MIDDFNREGLCINVDYLLPTERLISSLEQIIEWRSVRKAIRYDNGPEYISAVTQAWTNKRGIHIDFIAPGNPRQNAYVKRYNRTVRCDWLAHYLFDLIDKVQDFATRRLWAYNHERPNMAIVGITAKQKFASAA